MTFIRNLILFGNLIVFLVMVNWGIWTAEQNINSGTFAYMELQPRDPRSLFQGDYMVLNYALETQAAISRSGGDFPKEGFLVVRLDEQQVARFVRFHEGEVLEDGETLLKFTSPYGWTVEVGVGSYFFQEGHGDIYAAARYAEVRILEDGSVALIALRDENFTLLQAP
jgi:uncharacterized membrane-anchored protein